MPVGTCSACGECCIWAVLANKRGLSREQIEYLKARADRETDEYFLVKSPCKHLREEFGSDELIGRFCTIYDTRPELCRKFNGKKIRNGQRYYVPDSCTMREDK